MNIYPLLGQWLTSSNSKHAPLTVQAVEQAGFLATMPNCDEAYLDNALLNNKFAYGGYIEKRNLYERSPLFKTDDGFRNIHLGTDIWGEAGTALYAPIDLTIHSFKDNNNFGDYGPTVVFNGNTDYPHILLGHLSRADLDLWSSKGIYKQGDLIGHFGTKEENGGWYPHVHLQVVSNMLGRMGDFPGVYAQNRLHEIQAYLKDPKALFFQEN